MDKIMQKISAVFKGFFTWWANLTGLESKSYEKFGFEFGVNWPIISFVLVVTAAMVIFLPGGLLF